MKAHSRVLFLDSSVLTVCAAVRREGEEDSEDLVSHSGLGSVKAKSH